MGKRIRLPVRATVREDHGQATTLTGFTGSAISDASGSVSRRSMLVASVAAAMACALANRRILASEDAPATRPTIAVDPALARDWLARWRKNILGEARNRYCDRETGEEIGWLVSPIVNGFYYGYLATGEIDWLDRIIDWSDAWINRGIKEPDGFVGWPKADGASTDSVARSFTDNMLGDAMGLRPLVLLAGLAGKMQLLRDKYGARAERYLELAEQVFAKWDARGCWREVEHGGVWVVPEFGFDRQRNEFTAGYERRGTDGFSLPANKQNLIALWLIALHDVTGKAVYRDRAEKWWRVMKSRMRVRDEIFYVWNYWDPAGKWDYKPDGSTRHWVGVHPNGGYYGIDLDSIVAAYEHGLVFGKEEIDRLIATNRDFMWDGKVENAKFRSIDGGKADPRWKDTPGILWNALVPYDATLRKIFETNHDPDAWSGLAVTPWYLSLTK